MPVTPDRPAPYAPGAAIMQVIERHRERGLPSPITGEILGRAGVLESLVPRTLQALQILDLIDEKGAPTAAFEGIRKAPAGEYHARLTDWLNAAYADVLQFVDPATADEGAIRDAFRNYNPVGQQARMVSLFMALYVAAGQRPERSGQQRSTVLRGPRAIKPPLRTVPSAKPRREAPPSDHAPANIGPLPPTIAALLRDLPQPGGAWTQEKHDSFLAMFEAMLGYNYRIVAEAKPDEEEEEAA